MAVKTNERPGSRAELRYCRMSAYKAREVLDLIRGLDYTRAVELLDHSGRAAAPVVAKLLRSAAANAEHNDSQFPEELCIGACYADEGPTFKRFRPRARGRATRIRKRTCHITIILSRMPEDQIARLKARSEAQHADRRARRVAGARRRARALEAGEEAASLAAESGGEAAKPAEPRARRARKAAPTRETADQAAPKKAAPKKAAPAKAAPKKAAPKKAAPKKAAPKKAAPKKAAPAKAAPKKAGKATPAGRSATPKKAGKATRAIAKIAKKTTRKPSGKDRS